MSSHVSARNQGIKSSAPDTIFTLIKDKPITKRSSYIACLALDTSGSMSVSDLLIKARQQNEFESSNQLVVMVLMPPVGLGQAITRYHIPVLYKALGD